MLLADQWDVQPTIKRLVASLQARGYVVWFGAHMLLQDDVDAAGSHPRLCIADIECMKGSIVDA
eukprot:COSAG04_NODE_3235_length_3018_cov_5.967455_3_plen_64_part_00